MRRAPNRLFAAAAAVATAHTPLVRYTQMLQEPNPIQRIRNDIVANFQPHMELESFAGSTQEVAPLCCLITKVLSDYGDVDRLRYFFTCKFAHSRFVDKACCDAYVTALAKSNTASLHELDQTLAFLQRKGYTIDDPITRVSVAELRARCGVFDTGFWSAHEDIAATPSNGPTEDVLHMYLWALARSEQVDERLLRLRVVISCVSAVSLPSPLRADVAEAALAKACEEPLQVVQSAIARCRSEDALRVLRRFDKVDSPLALDLVNPSLLAGRYDDAAELLEACDAEDAKRGLWATTLSCEGIEAVDSLYFALERRLRDARPVTVRSLNVVCWACAALGDEVRVTQTVAAFELFGTSPNEDSTAAVAAAAKKRTSLRFTPVP